jgi:hypothetical protein
MRTCGGGAVVVGRGRRLQEADNDQALNEEQ